MNGRPAYHPGIDGLRAVAVAAVVLYHADVGWLPAGFFGVDVFFVISGYLITGLLLAEHRTRGGIGLRRFWTRRARRLLPAVLALLAVTVLVAVSWVPDTVESLRRDVPAALAYVSNWREILFADSYFQSSGRPSPLLHLWSLAIEEQFYVVWPLVVVFVLRRRRGRALLGVGALVAAVLSAVLMAALYAPDADPSRIYFGTDTRAAGLLLGAALAVAWPAARLRPVAHQSAARLVDGIGLAAAVGLIAVMIGLDARSATTYQGGFLLVATLSALLVAVAVHPSSRLATGLGVRPLRWLGTRSYAVYLWHWPVFVVTRPGLDVGIDGWRLLAVRLAIVAALAEASYRLVEQPWRTGAAQRAWRRLAVLDRTRIAGATTVTLAVLAAALVARTGPAVPPELQVAASAAAESEVASEPVGVATPAGADAPVAPSRSGSRSSRQAGATTSTQPPASPPTTTPVATASTTATTRDDAARPTSPTTAAAAAATTTTAPAAQQASATGAVLAIGDSVMLGAEPAMTAAFGPALTLDAKVARQVSDGIARLEEYRAAGRLAAAEVVVVHLGTNGAMSPEDAERLASVVADAATVVVVNVRVPRPWEGASNSSIAAMVGAHPDMRLVDWHTAAAGPGLLRSDGTHVTPEGARRYAELISAASR